MISASGGLPAFVMTMVSDLLDELHFEPADDDYMPDGCELSFQTHHPTDVTVHWHRVIDRSLVRAYFLCEYGLAPNDPDSWEMASIEVGVAFGDEIFASLTLTERSLTFPEVVRDVEERITSYDDWERFMEEHIDAAFSRSEELVHLLAAENDAMVSDDNTDDKSDAM